MSSFTDNLINRMQEAMKQSSAQKTAPYDTTAEVVRVQDGTAWVHIPGGVDETPVALTVDAHAGDTVQVRVSGGRAFLVGNGTRPPTDDTRANLASQQAFYAGLAAAQAAEQAQTALNSAGQANSTAQGARTVADNANAAAQASVSSDTMHYLATSISSGVTHDTAGWTTTIQNIDSENRYLWTYHTYTKANGSTVNTQPVITGVFGQKGATLTGITEYYAISATNTPPADSEFTPNVQSPTAEKPFLWNYELMEFSDGTSNAMGKHILMTYNQGDEGRGIASVVEYYALNNSTTAPADSAFRPNTPYTMTVQNRYLWNYERIEYTDGINPTVTAKRIIGVYGDTGQTGAKGDTGKALVDATDYYAINNSTTAPPDSAFSTAIQTPTPSNKYAWNYERMTWDDNGALSYTYTPKHVIAVYGDKGQPGAAGERGATGPRGEPGVDGKSITAITEYYALSQYPQPPDYQEFSTTVQTPTTILKYLWNYELLTWDDNGEISYTQTERHIAAVYGDTGEAGLSVTKVEPQYYLSLSPRATTGGSWGKVLKYEEGTYIWTRDEITYSNNSKSYSVPVYNAALTIACINAANAVQIANDTQQHFWMTETGSDTGAHITELSQEDFLLDPANGGANLLARSNGVAIRDGLTELATFSATTVQVGQGNTGHSIVDTAGMRVYGGDGTTLIANLGYGEGQSESGTSYAPYYTLGQRQAGSLIGNWSVAEGLGSIASAPFSHAEGNLCEASGVYSHAEGAGTQAIGSTSHAEGEGTKATGMYCHSEGFSTEATQMSAHAEGDSAKATGRVSHAEGYSTEASAPYSHAQNRGTRASSECQTAIGRYNIEDSAGTYAFIIGNGVGNNRSNALTVDWDGRIGTSALQCGQVAGDTVAANSYKDYTVTFPKAFPSVPIVNVTFRTGSTAYQFGHCSVAVYSESTTGFKIRFFNADSTSARSPGFNWMAMC